MNNLETKTRFFKGFLYYLMLLSVVISSMSMSSVESFAGGNLVLRNRQRRNINLHSRQQNYQYSRRTVSNSKSSTGKARLYSSNSSTPSSSSSSSNTNIRFLGRGSNAIVRPGVVLLAPAEEFHHYLRQSAVFIYAMGTDDNDEYVIRGVILDNPTPFSMGEMMESKTSGGVYDNLIYRGGESGGQEAFCLHSVDTMGLEEIGTSSIYQGGDLGKIDDPSNVKFFFNYMEFLEQELEDMLEIIHEDGDGWTSVEVPPEMVVDSDCDKGEAWSRLRNAIRGK